MHAFLITGIDKEKKDKEIQNLQEKYKAKIIEFPLKSIADVRSLGKFTKLSQKEDLLIVCKNIDKASQEALNAFLKNLEEPNKNVKFVLTADSTRKVLQTVVSRCQTINTKAQKDARVSQKSQQYLNSDLKKKIAIVDKIKKRDEALNFVEDVIWLLHNDLVENKEKFRHAKFLESANDCLIAIKANGNINLHLSKLTLNLSHKV